MMATATDTITGRVAVAPVLITVSDANDHAPKFTQQYFTPQISEGAPPGTTLMKVSTKDRDTGDNAHISYSIKSVSHEPADKLGKIRERGSDDVEERKARKPAVESSSDKPETSTIPPFVIDSGSGVVTLSHSLDRERARHHVFMVLATDAGTPALTSTALVRVTGG